jgi:hypothetical protein
MFKCPFFAITLEAPSSAMTTMMKMENSSVKAKEKLVAYLTTTFANVMIASKPMAAPARVSSIFKGTQVLGFSGT